MPQERPSFDGELMASFIKLSRTSESMSAIATILRQQSTTF
jgi:hypothetical protein